MPNPYLLASTRFREDPRLPQGKQLLLDALQEAQQTLTGVRPPQLSFIQSYEETIKNFQKIRGGQLFFPYLGSGMGHGPLVELLDGSVKYDMISGIGTHFWGHSYLPIVNVALEAALNDIPIQGHLQQNEDSVFLSDLLVKASGLDHCFLSTSGAMANENALKLAFQKKYPAQRILAFEKNFMGRTLTLSQITDKPAFREGLPVQLAVDYVPFYQVEDPKGSTEQAINALKTHLSRYPRQHAVMCFELIQGEAGINIGTTSFFSSLMKILREEGIAILIDEIQTFGRTSQLFAYQHFQLEPYVDLVSIGKIAQVCATLFRSPFKPNPGLLSQTFTSSTVALQTSRWMIEHLLSDHFFGQTGKNVTLYAHFEKHFKRLEERWPDRIQGPNGMGAMIAFTPCQGEYHSVFRFAQDLFQAGVMAFTAGTQPTRIRFLVPAGVMTKEDVDTVMEILEKVLMSKL